MKRRAATLAWLSVASFALLTYWGVSSSTKQLQQDTQRSPAKQGPSGAESEPAARSATEATGPALATVANEPRETTASTTSTALPAEPALAEPKAIAGPDEPDKTAHLELTSSGTPPPTTETPPEPPVVAREALLAQPTTPQPSTTAPQAAVTEPAAANPVEPTAATLDPAASATTTPQAKPELPPAETVPLHARKPLLFVRAVPESARLWLDGQRMANPFDVRLPHGSKHRIEARAEGYESSAQSVRLESDAKLTIGLRRSPPPQVSRSDGRHAPTAKAARPTRGAGFVSLNPY